MYIFLCVYAPPCFRAFEHHVMSMCQVCLFEGVRGMCLGLFAGATRVSGCALAPSFFAHSLPLSH